MSPAAASNANARGKKKGFMSGITSGGGAGRTVFMAATAMGLMAVLVTAGILGTAADTATYYVLNADVAARTQITPDMLKAVTTSTEGVPTAAKDLVFVTYNEVFAKYSLQANDLVTSSNAGALESINKDLPAGFVVASLMAPPEDEVDGKIRRGDYIDAYAVGAPNSATGAGGNTISKLVLHHMLVLDVTVSPSTITAAAGQQAGSNLAPGPESAAARSGIPSLYTVAVTPMDAAKISVIRGKSIFLTLSSNDAGKGPVDVQQGLQKVFGSDPVGDSGAGTAAALAAGKQAAADAAARAAGKVVRPRPTATATR